MTTLKTFARLATLAPLVVVLACVAGQKVDTTYSPEPESVAADQGAVTLSVTDQREYVLSGAKDPSYIGKFRAGFGNTWDVKTEGQVPLAELIAKDLGADLEALGFSLPEGVATPRRLEVSIKDWNSDSYKHAEIWYDLDVRVTDGQGEMLHEETIKKENIVIEGSAMTGPKKAFMKEYPGIYKGVIMQIARDNDAVLNALREQPSADAGP
jgi:hypothetical protein